MTEIQAFIVFLSSIYNVYGVIKGYFECVKKGNAYGLTPQFYLHGGFVWGDVVFFGIFWIILGVVSLMRQDWLLFLLVFMIFWVVRSVGETIYWFLEQFTPNKKNPPHSLPGFGLVKNDSIHFIYQICMQMITIISLMGSIVLIPLWLKSLGIL